MKLKSAEFSTSAPNIEACPKDNKPEFAFIGRSNVGKSSLINYIVDRPGLALTSSKPGKTRTINHFIINNSLYFVDLPGYGFARVSKGDRNNWLKSTQDYILKRENLVCVFVLLDLSIPPQQADLDFIYWLGSNEKALAIVFTKSDKIKSVPRKKNLELFRERLREYWDDFPNTFLTSVERKEGKEDILNYIGSCLEVQE